MYLIQKKINSNCLCYSPCRVNKHCYLYHDLLRGTMLTNVLKVIFLSSCVMRTFTFFPVVLILFTFEFELR